MAPRRDRDFMVVKKKTVKKKTRPTTPGKNRTLDSYSKPQPKKTVQKKEPKNPLLKAK